MRRPDRGGLALILVAGVLGILAVLATAFVTMAQLERRASMQRLHATKAELLARSGIEDALARLGQGQDPEAASNRYQGEDWDGDGGALDPYEAAQEVYQAGTANRDDCPVRQALRPSFFAADGTGKPWRTPMEGRDRGYSGRLSESGGGTYALKVQSGGIYVNGGDPAQAANLGYNAVLRRILGTLAEAIDREDGTPDGLPVGQADGFNLIDLRPSTGWRDWNQVRDLALGGSQGKSDVLRSYLSLHAWVDRKVIRPNATNALSDLRVQTWSDIRLGRGSSAFPPTRGVPGFEMIHGRNVGRAPVSLAWARNRRPVLLALLGNLEGVFLNERWRFGWFNTDQYQIGTLRKAVIELAWQQTDDAHLVADLISLPTIDLSTWEQWDRFCDTLPVSASNSWGAFPQEQPALRQAKRDLLKANFNPNSDLNKFNPNVSLWRLVDKQDLLTYSTEFSLDPTSPVEIECVGRVLGRDGRLVASRVLRGGLASPSVVRLTTQKEFVCEKQGRLDLAGDESDFRLPGCTAPDFVNQSYGMGKTWGHRLDMTWKYHETWLNGASLGAALQSYPEPCVDTGIGLSINPADYDGNLQLATVETVDDDSFDVPSTTRDMKMLACFTQSFDLALSANGKKRCHPDLLQAATTELGLSLLDGAKPNTLHPDGCFSEKDRSPAYLDRGSAHPYHGLLSLWVKPNYRDVDDSVVAPHWTYVDRSNLNLGGPGTHGGKDQCFVVVQNARQFWQGVEPPGLGGFFEQGHELADENREHVHATPTRPVEGHRWMLLTFFWDALAPAGEKHTTGRLFVNEGTDIADASLPPQYSGTDNTPREAADLTAEDEVGPHRVTLGNRMPEDRGAMSLQTSETTANATLDEFAMYDFGGATFVSGIGFEKADSSILDSPAQYAPNRFQWGRYYCESAYEDLTTPPGPTQTAAAYFTSVLTLPTGAFLKQVHWTLVRPRELPTDYVQIELTDALGISYLVGAYRSRSPASAHPREWEPRLKVDSPFRIHVVFRRETPLAPGVPLLDSPALDDVTVVYEPMGGRRILSWDTGE